MINITTEDLEKYSDFKALVNKTPLEEILLGGKLISSETIADWTFTGLSNMDLLLSIDDVEQYKREITLKVFDDLK